MDAPSYLQITVGPLLVPVLSTIGALVHTTGARRRRRDADVVGLWVRWWFLGAMAASGVVIFLSYLLAPLFMAGTLAFPTSVPFEHEVGAANLGFALAALLAVRRGVDARLTAAVGYGAFLYVAAAWHVVELVAHGDTAPGNTVGVLVFDLLVPPVALLLVALERRGGRPAAAAEPAARPLSRS